MKSIETKRTASHRIEANCIEANGKEAQRKITISERMLVSQWKGMKGTAAHCTEVDGIEYPLYQKSCRVAREKKRNVSHRIEGKRTALKN